MHGFLEPRPEGRVLYESAIAEHPMKTEKIDDKLDPKAKGKSVSQSDFDRNRDGLYGGLPKARDKNAPGPYVKQPHPSR